MQSCWGTSKQYPPTPLLLSEGDARGKVRWNRLTEHAVATFPLLLPVAADDLHTLNHESCWCFPVSREPVADRVWHALVTFPLLLAVSKLPFRHPACEGIAYRLNMNPAGVSLFRMRVPQKLL